MLQRSRREVLGALAGTGAVAVAGCLGTDKSVSLLSAGSLAAVMEGEVGPAFEEETGISLRGEYHGANIVMRMIEDGQKHPDVAISADVQLLRDRLYPDHTDWDVVFGANEVGLAYEPETDLGERLDAGEPWYEVLRDADDGDVAISDPDLDPLGYRAIHMLELAAEYHDVDGLGETVLDGAYLEPDEPQLLAGIEAGNRAIAISYRNMAHDHDVPFYELSPEFNFSDPAYADWYESVSYTTDDGHTVRGSTMLYNATVLADADDPEAGREFLAFLLDSPSLLEANGITVPDRLPRANGPVPEQLADRIDNGGESA